MTLSLPTYRNSFHPAWLLLLLPPLLGLVRQALGFDAAALVTDTARLALALLMILPLFLGRFREVPGGFLCWMKEMRIHWLGAAVGVGVSGLLLSVRWQGQVPEGFGEWAMGIGLSGALVSGALTFGEEFEQRTLAGLLSQPRSRSALYRQKLLPLAGILVWIATNLSLGLVASGPSDPGDFAEVLVGVWGMVLLVFCTAPLYTLLTRSTLAGAIFVVAAPLVLWSLVALAASALERWGGLAGVHQVLEQAFFWMAPAYAVVGAWLGWRCFAQLEVPDARAGHGVSHPLSLPVDRLLSGALPRWSWVPLVRKEMRLHVVPWLVAGIFCALWILWMVIRALWPDDGPSDDGASALPSAFGILAVIMGLMSLIVSGAACVAEERQLGTLDWQLTQPMSLSRQWWIKLGVALGLFVVLGVALPLALLVLGFGAEPVLGNPSPDFPLILGLYGGGILLVFALAAYASSFCRSTMKASATAVALGLALGSVPFPVIAWMGVRMDAISSETALELAPAPSWAPGQEAIRWVGVAGLVAGALILLSLLLALGRRNFSRASVPETLLVRQWMLLVAVVLGSLLLVSETMLQLTRLQLRADAAAWRGHRGAQIDSALRDLVHWHLDRGGLDAEVLRGLRLDPGASRESIVQTLTQVEDLEAREAWVQILFNLATAGHPTRPGAALVDPLLGLRYGMSVTNLVQRRLQEAASPLQPKPGLHRLDPVLQKRYGLAPEDPAPAAPPSPP
ncbi:MAG: ABC transporter permease subunit [Verrucomicrobia bacterium]|nr:ABC transporter permease subunit [Verrucomicrobiota bacterium]